MANKKIDRAKERLSESYSLDRSLPLAIVEGARVAISVCEVSLNHQLTVSTANQKLQLITNEPLPICWDSKSVKPLSICLILFK
ncbi:MAG: hypothetical protein GY927_12885 [bacterium]|nr:hypothetical protein [bacterium]